jgi:hypothetical protein
MSEFNELTAADVNDGLCTLPEAAELGFSNVYVLIYKLFDENRHWIERRLDAHDVKFSEVEARFDRLDARFEGLDARVNGIEAKVDDLTTSVKGLAGRFDVLTTIVKRIDAKLL